MHLQHQQLLESVCEIARLHEMKSAAKIPRFEKKGMKAGSKVVCIDDYFDEHARSHLKYFPVKGAYYTIRGLMYDLDFPDPSLPSILLEEIVNPYIHKKNNFGVWKHLEPRFKKRRFREVHPMEIEGRVMEGELRKPEKVNQ